MLFFFLACMHCTHPHGRASVGSSTVPHHIYAGGVLLERWTLQHTHSNPGGRSSLGGRSYVDENSIYKRMVGKSIWHQTPLSVHG